MKTVADPSWGRELQQQRARSLRHGIKQAKDESYYQRNAASFLSGFSDGRVKGGFRKILLELTALLRLSQAKTGK